MLHSKNWHIKTFFAKICKNMQEFVKFVKIAKIAKAEKLQSESYQGIRSCNIKLTYWLSIS
jgi:hypothetical protein